MRVYLVIMDESDEARKAMRYTSRRAQATDGAVNILALVQPQNFSAFGGVQATIEQEARDRAEVLASSAAGNLYSESGQMPSISVRVGEGQAVIKEYLTDHPEVSELVLGAAAEGSPGPLIAHFATHSGGLPCPVTIVPGNFTNEDIDRVT